MQWRDRTGAAGVGGPMPHAERRRLEVAPSDAQGGDMVIATASEGGWRATERAGQECDGERALPRVPPR